MKYLLILFTLLFISCDIEYKAPKGMTYLVTLPNGKIIETDYYSIKEGNFETYFTIEYPFSKDEYIDVVILPYQDNLLYEKGYKRGQIDILEGKGCYAKVLTNDGEVLWKDTCSVKRKPKI